MLFANQCAWLPSQRTRVRLWDTGFVLNELFDSGLERHLIVHNNRIANLDKDLSLIHI